MPRARRELTLETNDANSYLAGTIGEQADRDGSARPSRSRWTARPRRLLLDSISTIRGELVEAADGASQLADGARGRPTAPSQLGSGAAQLADGTAQLATGNAQLAAGSPTLAAGADRSPTGNAQLAASADRVGAAVDEADAPPCPRRAPTSPRGSPAAGVDQATIDDVLARLDPVGDDLEAGNARVQEVVGQIDQLAGGQRAGRRRLRRRWRRVRAPRPTARHPRRPAPRTLRDGIGTLGAGLDTLRDGAGTLRDGLDDGVAAIPDSDQAHARRAGRRPSPTRSRSQTAALAQAGNYGAGLAPFFAALAGWIGIYALFLIVKPISRRAVTALHSPIRVTLAGLADARASSAACRWWRCSRCSP